MNADMVALALPALCELVWALSQGYKFPSADIAEAIRRLLSQTPPPTGGVRSEPWDTHAAA